MSNIARLATAISAVVLALLISPASQAQPSAPAEVAWRLLDYLAVDYSGAVADGRVTSASEYAEMREFAASVRARIASLPATKAKPALEAKALALAQAIDRRAAPAEVARQARSLASDLLAAYPTPLAPARAPDVARGAALYAENCASCHGASGRGDGPAAQGLDPAPVNFTTMDRARERSVFGLYQVIGQGIDGTAMPSFSHFSADDRWALAFYVGSLAYSPEAERRGRDAWRKRADARSAIPDLKALTQITPSALSARLGEPTATDVTAYLRRQPSAALSSGGGLAVSRKKLAESLAAYRNGDAKLAQELALSAYLDGFEPLEPSLRARNGALLGKVESAMAELRAGLARGASVTEVSRQVGAVETLLDEADLALSPHEGSAASAFLGSLTILLREGVEALLIVIAMIAFLRRAERQDVLPYVHAGWASALAAGAATWLAATFLISISGASREVTEGVGSLVSAIVLISVGVWMHGKAQAGAWQVYIREKLSAALSRQSAWFLFLLAFIVVYREVFETILFYAALWSQGAQAAMLAGAGAGIICLGVIAWALLRFSQRLPISKFFSYSAIMIAVLAVVLAGKGTAALQEAGLVGVNPLGGWPRIDVLGVFPTIEGMVMQVLTLMALALGFWMSGNAGKPAARA